jgi:hypothetical protein
MAFDPLKSLNNYLSNNQFKMPSFKPNAVVTPTFDQNTQNQYQSRIPEGPEYRPPVTTNTQVGYTPEQQAQYNKTFAMFSNPVVQTDTSSAVTTKDITSSSTIKPPLLTPSTNASNALAVTGGAAAEQAIEDAKKAAEDAKVKAERDAYLATPKGKAEAEYLKLTEAQGNRATDTAAAQKEQDTAGKTKALNDINSKILTTSRAYEKQLREIEKNSQGMLASGINSEVQRVGKMRDEQLADLSIQKAVALGDLETANSIVKQAMDAKYEPIAEQLKSLETLFTMYQNDMTESEKFEATNKLNASKEEATYLKGLQTALINDANQSGQSSVASEAIKLDPTSPTFKADLAALQAKVVKETSGGSGMFGNLPVSTQNKVISIANGFGSESEIKRFKLTVDAVNTITSIDPNSKNPALHQSVVYNFAKALDPESVVREGEYATVKKYSQSLFNKYKGEISNAINGTGFLSPKAITDIQSAIQNLYDARLPQYKNSFEETSRVIDNIAGAPVSGELMIDYRGGYSGGSSGSNQPSQIEYNGKIYNVDENGDMTEA